MCPASLEARELLVSNSPADEAALRASWRIKDNTVFQIVNDDASAAVGNYIKVSVGDQELRRFGEITQAVSVKPYTQYTVKAMLKSDIPETAFVQIKHYKGENEIQRFNIGYSDGPQWKQVQETFSSGDSDRIVVYLRWDRTQKHLGHTASFANVSMMRVGPAPREVVSDAPHAVPTFHSMGLYWKPKDAAADRICKVKFKAQGSDQWQDGLDLWFDTNDHPEPAKKHSGEYRGSLVYLKPATTYDIQLTLPATGNTQTLTATTWDENFPIAKRVEVVDGNQTLVIQEGGSSQAGYVLYEPTRGQTGLRDAQRQHEVNIQVNAPYVIIKGFTLKNAITHGIELRDVHHIVIDDCDISGWGRTRKADGYGSDLNSAIFSKYRKLEHVVIQNCNLHHPQSDSNSWNQKRVGSSKHPAGPQGITFRYGQGRYVIRYNRIHSDLQHMFNDGMGEVLNFSFGGFPNRDTDIYGNYVSHCWDDGLEIEGANMNVRVWNNYIDMTYGAIGAASPSLGPIYFFRNVYAQSRKHEGNKTNDLTGHYLIKLGNPNTLWTAGKMYLFHNTALQPAPFPQNKSFTSSGAQAGIIFTSKTKTAFNITSRNNILQMRRDKDWAIRDFPKSPTNDYDFDLYAGRLMVRDDAQQNGIAAVPIYERSPDGRLWLAPGTPGYDAGQRIANFNDDFQGQAPDMGAVETHATSSKPSLWPAFPEPAQQPQ
ncbi:MAG: hypothetical protein CMJ19_25250 [Phycisphaeraceae bacterium]|nr:hypothetical protein [Phycisphaeraceae bacterium]